MEIQLIKIKSIYGDIKGLLSQIPSITEMPFIDYFTVETFNNVIDKLSKVSETDYSNYKIPNSISRGRHARYEGGIVRAQIGRVIGRLEEEYSFGKENNNHESPNIVILNKNENELSLRIDYTMNDLIDEIGNEENKKKLRSLKDELEKTDKDWEKIKSILIWILNFSKELFLKVLPILLEKKL